MRSHTCFWKNKDNLFKCPCYFLIPRFPFVLKCGLPSCHLCFPKSFKCNEWCNYCIIPVQIEDILTLNNDRLCRFKSLTAQMYEEAEIQCTNTGWKLKFNIDEINKHEFFDCPYRIIQCLAKDCYYKNNPTQVHKHALQCFFFEFYSGTCYGAYGAEIVEHSCAIMLQQQLLEYARILISGLSELKNHNNGDVILPPHVTHEPLDILALSEVRLKINSSSPLRSGAGLTWLVPRIRVIQRQNGISRASDSENDIIQFDFIWLTNKLHSFEFIAYFIGSIISSVLSVIIYRVLKLNFSKTVLLCISWSILFNVVVFNQIVKQ